MSSVSAAKANKSIFDSFFQAYLSCIRSPYYNNCIMQPKSVFTEQSRQEIAKSNLNNSRSKQLWTFSKKQRFDPVRPTCPNAFYSKPPSTLSNKKMSFATSLRRVFTETSDAPLPGTYSAKCPKDGAIKGLFFG